MPYVTTLWVADTIVLVGIIVALVRLRGERLGELLLGSRARISADTWLGLALIPVLSVVVIGALTLVRWAWPELHNVQANPFEALIRSPRDAVMLGAVAVLSGGMKEEMQRAFVLRRFDQHLGGARVAAHERYQPADSLIAILLTEYVECRERCVPSEPRRTHTATPEGTRNHQSPRHACVP